MDGMHSVDGLPIDAWWPKGVDPASWRDAPDPDGDEFDDNGEGPTPGYVTSLLGFDPDGEGWL